MKAFQRTQLAFTEYLRGITNGNTTEERKPRQQEIYRDLVYKNINQCVSDVFPITKSIISESDWEATIREFIRVHPSQTPYFLEICQEFLAYFVNTRKLQHTDHPFIIELMHFEWIQLAVDIVDINFPEIVFNTTPNKRSPWKASPLVAGLTYSYPVHLIDEEYLPEKPTAQPTHLLVYRNRNDQLKTSETDYLGLRIIQLLQSHENITYLQILQFLSDELDSNLDSTYKSKIWSTLVMFATNDLVLISQTRTPNLL